MCMHVFATCGVDRFGIPKFYTRVNNDCLYLYCYYTLLVVSRNLGLAMYNTFVT